MPDYTIDYGGKKYKLSSDTPLTDQDFQDFADSIDKGSSTPSSGFDADTIRGAAGKCGPGLDCSAFTQNIYRGLGLRVPRTAVQQYDKAKRVLGEDELDLSKLQPGDLVFFDNGSRSEYSTAGKKRGSGYVNHVGVYLGDGKFLHDPGNSSDNRVEVDLQSYVKRGIRLMGAGRFGGSSPVSAPPAQKPARKASPPPESPSRANPRAYSAPIGPSLPAPVGGTMGDYIPGMNAPDANDLNRLMGNPLASVMAGGDSALMQGDAVKGVMAGTKGAASDLRSRQLRIRSLLDNWGDGSHVFDEAGIDRATLIDALNFGSKTVLDSRTKTLIPTAQALGRVRQRYTVLAKNANLDLKRMGSEKLIPTTIPASLLQGTEIGTVPGIGAPDKTSIPSMITGQTPQDIRGFEAAKDRTLKYTEEALQPALGYKDPWSGKLVAPANATEEDRFTAEDLAFFLNPMNWNEAIQNMALFGGMKLGGASDAQLRALEQMGITNQIKSSDGYRNLTALQRIGFMGASLLTPGANLLAGGGFLGSQAISAGDTLATEGIKEGSRKLLGEFFQSVNFADKNLTPVERIERLMNLGLTAYGAKHGFSKLKNFIAERGPAISEMFKGGRFTNPIPGAFGKAMSYLEQLTANGPAQPAEPQTGKFMSAEGRPFYETRMNPNDIGVEPGMQYKKAGITDNLNQVSDELKGVGKYDQATAGPLTVWEKKDGTRVVMNGHHRRELAIRTGEESVLVRIFKETDGVDFNTARAYGAFQNIKDGKGTAFDAAMVLRDLNATPEDLAGYGINIKRGIGRDAVALLKLEPDALRFVQDGQVPEVVAGAIGEADLPPDRQIAAMKEALRSGLETRNQGKFLAERAKVAPMVDKTGGMGDLFGEFDMELALGEQAKLVENATKRLASDKRLYEAMTRGRAVGNTSVDKVAQLTAAQVEEFAGKVMATSPEVQKVIQDQAAAYAQNPTKKQLETSTKLITDAARKASQARLEELFGNRSQEEVSASQTAYSVMNDLSESRSRSSLPGGQVKPSPLPGGTSTRTVSDILGDLMSGLEKNVYQRRGPKRSGGHYNPDTGGVVTKYAGDFETAAHELAHALDDKFDILGESRHAGKLGAGEFDAELQPFWENGMSSYRPDRSNAYARQEGVAEFFRAYAQNPEQAIQMAPKFWDQVKKTVPPGSLRILEKFSDDIRQWHGMTAVEQSLTNVQMDPRTVRTTLKKALQGEGYDFKITPADRWSHYVTTSTRYFEKAISWVKEQTGGHALRPSEDPQILLELHRGVSGKVLDMMESGMRNGKGEVILSARTQKPLTFDYILEPLDKMNLEADMKAANALMVSERTLEFEQNLYLDADTALERYAKKLEKERDARIEEYSNQLARRDQAQLGGKKETKAIVRKRAEELAQFEEALIRQDDARVSRMQTRLHREAGRRAQRSSGIGAGVKSDIDVAQKVIDELKANPERYAALQESATRYREVSGALLDYMVEKGRISAESARTIKKRNEYYVSFQRIVEDYNVRPGARQGRGGSLGSKSEVIKKRKGGTEMIQNAYQGLLDQWHAIIRETDRNEVLASFAEIAYPKGESPRRMGSGPAPILEEVIKPALSPDRGNQITIYRDGEPERFEIHPDVFAAIKHVSGEDVGMLLRGLQKVTGASARLLTNWNPAFALVRNPIRDTMTRVVVSEVGSNFLDFRLGKAGGKIGGELAAHGGHQGDRWVPESVGPGKYLREAVEDLKAKDARAKIVMPLRVIKNAFKGYKRLTGDMEMVNRIAEYQGALDHIEKTNEISAERKVSSPFEGWTEYDKALYAASKARGILDFSRGGVLAKHINRLIPFTNASVQGLDVAARSFKSNPVAFTQRATLYSIVPAMIEYAWNARDKDSLEKYRQSPAYIRDYFFQFHVGGNVYLLPKGFETALPGSLVSRLIDLANGNEHAMEGFQKSAMTTLMGVRGESFLLPEMQVMANRDTFRDRPIVPPWEENLDPALRDESSASRLAQGLSKILNHNWDAREIDFWLKARFGGPGSIATALSDIGRDRGERKDGTPRRAVSDTTTNVLGTLTGLVKPEFGYASRDVVFAMDTGKRYGFQPKLISDYGKAIRMASTVDEKQKLEREMVQAATRARKNFELDLRRNPNLTPEEIKELAKGHFNP